MVPEFSQKLLNEVISNYNEQREDERIRKAAHVKMRGEAANGGPKADPTPASKTTTPATPAAAPKPKADPKPTPKPKKTEAKVETQQAPEQPAPEPDPVVADDEEIIISFA